MIATYFLASCVCIVVHTALPVAVTTVPAVITVLADGSAAPVVITAPAGEMTAPGADGMRRVLGVAGVLLDDNSTAFLPLHLVPLVMICLKV